MKYGPALLPTLDTMREAGRTISEVNVDEPQSETLSSSPSDIEMIEASQKLDGDLVRVLARAVQVLQTSLIRAHRKLIELEADMAAAGIGGANGQGSKLIGIEPEKRVIQPGRASVRTYGKKSN